jgi:hypothetical protein
MGVPEGEYVLEGVAEGDTVGGAGVAAEPTINVAEAKSKPPRALVAVTVNVPSEIPGTLKTVEY